MRSSLTFCNRCFQLLWLLLHVVIQMNPLEYILFYGSVRIDEQKRKIKRRIYPKFFISILGERIQIGSDGSCEECGILWNDTQSRS